MLNHTSNLLFKSKRNNVDFMSFKSTSGPIENFFARPPNKPHPPEGIEIVCWAATMIQQVDKVVMGKVNGDLPVY